MSEDWSDSSNNEIASHEASRSAKLSNRISNGLIILHTIAAFTYVIGILLVDVDVTDQTVDLFLMMKMKYPFVIDTQHEYRIVLVTQFMYVMVCSWGAGLFNALFLTLVTCILSKYH
jgi:hypothetical protein